MPRKKTFYRMSNGFRSPPAHKSCTDGWTNVFLVMKPMTVTSFQFEGYICMCSVQSSIIIHNTSQKTEQNQLYNRLKYTGSKWMTSFDMITYWYSTAAVIKKSTPLVGVITWLSLRAPLIWAGLGLVAVSDPTVRRGADNGGSVYNKAIDVRD